MVWWQPHAAALVNEGRSYRAAVGVATVGTEDAWTMMDEGMTVFHHSVTRGTASALNASQTPEALWLSFLVWFHVEAPGKGKGGAMSKSKTDQLTPLWHSPVMLAKNAAAMRGEQELVALLASKWGEAAAGEADAAAGEAAFPAFEGPRKPSTPVPDLN